MTLGLVWASCCGVSFMWGKTNERKCILHKLRCIDETVDMRKKIANYKSKRIICIILSMMLAFSIIVQPDLVRAEVTAPAELAVHHAYTAIDARTGEVLLSDKADKKVYPASTTKLMTAIVVLEKTKTNKNIKVTSKMIKALPSGCSNYGIKAGESYKVGTLLNMLLICSAGDAGICLAIGVFGSVDKCVAAMNRKCKTLGLKGTHFDNPIGLDIGNGYKKNYTTANDMALITRCAMSNTAIKTIVGRKSFVVHQSNGKKGRRIKSTNRFYYDQSYSDNMYTVIGTKSGTTNAAGNVFAATAIDEEGREVICVYMGKKNSDSTFEDIRKIFDAVYNAQEDGEVILSEGRIEIQTKVEQNEVEQIELPYSENGTITLNMTIVDTDSSYEWDKNAEKITYTTSDKSVVAVDSNGKLTIKGTGTATIVQFLRAE